MRVSEQTRGEELTVLSYLRRGIEGRPRVVEIHVTRLVEPSVVAGADLVETCRGPVVRVLFEKLAKSIGSHGIQSGSGSSLAPGSSSCSRALKPPLYGTWFASRTW